MKKLLMIEFKKIRSRHSGLIYAGLLLITFLWICFAMRNMDSRLSGQGYFYILLSIPLINTVLLPTILAVIESRICDMEVKGNTFKLLCTIQSKESIYHSKLLLGSLYLLFFTLGETALIFVLGILFPITQPLPLYHIGIFFISTLLVSEVLILIQQPLSLISKSQLFPLFTGVGGTFFGLFIWFFPDIPLRYLVPWGYYCVSTPISIEYSEAAETAAYHSSSFPLLPFLLFLLFGVFSYFTGKQLFKGKEV